MDGIGTGLAIAGAIVTTGKVIKQIKDFITDSKTVDESVKGFLNEVEALQSVLEAIKDSFANIGSLAEEREGIRKLWSSVDKTIENCQHSLGKLHLIFRRLGKQAGNGYQAIVKQLKVKSKTDDIANIRRQIISYNITFQTAITSITLCVVLQNRNHQPNQDLAEIKRLEACQKDEIALVDNNENDDEDEEILADIEACKQSAKAILSSATTVMEQWSTTGSEFGLELGVAKREELEQWVEKLHISNSSSSYPKSDSTVEDTVSVTSNSTGPVITRDEREPRPSRKDWTKEELGVREDLIREGIVEFYKGDYSDANGCFQRAYDLGFIQRSRRNPTSDTGRTGDEALKLCTCLATLRWSNAEQLPLSELLRQKSLEMLGLDGRRDYIRTNDPKLNWLYANIYLELGELQKAESRCQFAFEHYPRNQRLPPKNDGVYVPGDYDDVILTMVAILYTKHLAALAKFWKAKVSARSLQAKGAQFFVMRGESKPPSELSISTAIKQQNFTAALWLDQYPSSHSTLDLREAIKVKSFPLISMIVDHCEASKPGDSQIDTVLHEAVEQDNLPAVEFLLEAGLDIDSLCLLVTDRFPSRSTYPQKFSLRTDQVCTPLGRAIYHGQLAVSEILLQKGASLALRNESVLYLAIHSPSWQNTIPLLLRYGTNVNVLFPLLPEVTTLSYAVQRSEGLYCGDGDDDTLVRMLVEAGADLNKPSTLTESMDFNSFNYTNKPLTPLEMARILKLHNVEKCLLEAGAKDNDALDLYSLPVKPASKGASLSHNISPVPTDERSELKLQKRKGFRAMFGRSKNN